MNFHRFPWILWISIDFEVRGFATLQDGKGRPVAPIETFTRSQLAAISSIFMDFNDFQMFSDDFMRFHGFRGSGVKKTCGRLCKRSPVPVETFTRSQLAAILSFFIDFHDFHRFSKDSMRFHGFRGSGVGAGCYFIDFHRFS